MSWYEAPHPIHDLDPKTAEGAAREILWRVHKKRRDTAPTWLIIFTIWLPAPLRVSHGLIAYRRARRDYESLVVAMTMFELLDTYGKINVVRDFVDLHRLDFDEPLRRALAF